MLNQSQRRGDLKEKEKHRQVTESIDVHPRAETPKQFRHLEILGLPGILFCGTKED